MPGGEAATARAQQEGQQQGKGKQGAGEGDLEDVEPLRPRRTDGQRLHQRRVQRESEAGGDHPEGAAVVGRESCPAAGNGADEGGRFHDRSFTVSAATSRSEEHTSELQSLMRISYAV